MSHDVFISYASADKEIAVTICEALEKEGPKCWIAPRDILVGSYGAAIIKAINNSKLMVLVLSSHANQSEHVHREVERAAGKGIDIYPFRIEEVLPSEDLELFISSEQWLDAFPSPLEHLEQLIENVKLLLRESGGRLPSPPPRSSWPIKLKEVAPLWVAVVTGGLIVLLIGWIWFNPWGDVVANQNNHKAGPEITPSAEVNPTPTRTSETANSNVQPNPTATAAIVTPTPPPQTTPFPVATVVESLQDTQWEYRRLGGRVEYVWEFHPNKRFRTRRVNQGTYLPDGTWEQAGDTIIIRIGDANNPETYKGKIRGNQMEGDFIALNPTRWSALRIVP